MAGETINHKVNILIKVVDQASKQLQNTSKKASELSNSLRNIQSSFLGVGLSFLFTGMAIKKFFEDIMRRAINSYMQMADSQSEILGQVLHLQAAWAFLQYSIANALAETGMLEWVAEIIRRITDYLNNLSPEAKQKLVDIAIAGVILGTVMMITGQTLLFFVGLMSAMNFLPQIIGLMLIAAAFMIIKGSGDDATTTVEGLGLGIVALGIALLGLSLPLAIFLIGIGGVIFMVALFTKKTGSFGKGLLLFFMLVMNGIDTLMTMMLSSVTLMIDTILTLIAMLLFEISRIPFFSEYRGVYEGLAGFIEGGGTTGALKRRQQERMDEQEKITGISRDWGEGEDSDLADAFSKGLSDTMGELTGGISEALTDSMDTMNEDLIKKQEELLEKNQEALGKTDQTNSKLEEQNEKTDETNSNLMSVAGTLEGLREESNDKTDTMILWMQLAAEGIQELNNKGQSFLKPTDK